MILLFFIALFIGLNVSSHLLVLIIIVPLIVFLFFRIGKKKTFITLAFFILGIGLSFINVSFEKEEYKCVVVEVRDNYYIASSSFEKLYIYEKEHTQEVGDIITFVGEKKQLSFASTESAFDFEEYLNNKGVFSELKFTSKTINYANPLKINALKKRFLSRFNEDTSGVIRSLFFGYRDYTETVELFSSLHLTRLLSTSGIYLSVFLSLFTFLFSYLFKEKYASLFANLILIIYSVFTFPRFVVMKYVVMCLFSWVNKYPLKSKFHSEDVLGLTGMMFLLIDHYLAFQDSFLLAYLIPVVLFVFRNSFPYMKKRYRRLITPLLVSLTLLPFVLAYYHEISPLSMVISILFIPLMVGFIFLIFLSFIGIPIYGFLNGIVNFINKFMKFLFPIFFKIYAPEFSFFGLVIYYCLLFVIIYFFSIKLKDLYKLSLVMFLGFDALYFLPFARLIRPSVSFINVGQGDSCLIDYKGTSILIDTGGSKKMDIATETLIPYLKKQRIYSLDLLITTHDDFDHSGAVSSLVNNFKVKEYVTDYRAFPIKIGNSFEIKNYNVYPELWKEENDSSLVLGFTIHNDDYLIMGDAPKKIENAIIKDYPNITCDILKVGHHGSKTSSGDLFISTIKPKEAIISCGENNSYGHPHKETLNILRKYSVKIRRTDLEGTIKYSYFF